MDNHDHDRIKNMVKHEITMSELRQEQKRIKESTEEYNKFSTLRNKLDNIMLVVSAGLAALFVLNVMFALAILTAVQ